MRHLNLTFLPAFVFLWICNFSLPLLAQSPDGDAINGALRFDGENDYISVRTAPLLGATDQFTIELWVSLDKLRNLQGQNPIYGEYKNTWNGTANYFGVRSNGRLFFDQWPPNGGAFDSESQLEMGSWYHVAYVQDGNTEYFYVNGELDKTRERPEPPINNRMNQAWLGARGGTDDNRRFFGGTMDEFRIWNLARSQEDIANNMDRQLAGTEEGLVVYYPFNEGEPDAENFSVVQLADLSGQGQYGELHNFTQTGNNSNWVEGYPLVSSDNRRLPRDWRANFDGTAKIFDESTSEFPANEATVSVWVKWKQLTGRDDGMSPMPPTPQGATIFNYDEDQEGLSNSHRLMLYDLSALSIAWSGAHYSSDIDLSDGEWHHVAIGISPNDSGHGYKINMFVDGTLRHSKVLYSDEGTDLRTGGPLVLGARYGNSDGGEFSGSMSGFSIWNTSLEVEEVIDIMSAVPATNDPGLALFWELEEAPENARSQNVVYGIGNYLPRLAREKGLFYPFRTLSQEEWRRVRQRNFVPSTVEQATALATALFTPLNKSRLNGTGYKTDAYAYHEALQLGLGNPALRKRDVESVEATIMDLVPQMGAQTSVREDGAFVFYYENMPKAPIIREDLITNSADILSDAKERYSRWFEREPIPTVGRNDNKTEIWFVTNQTQARSSGRILLNHNEALDGGRRQSALIHELFHLYEFAFAKDRFNLWPYSYTHPLQGNWMWWIEGLARWAEARSLKRIVRPTDLTGLYEMPELSLLRSHYQALPFWLFVNRLVGDGVMPALMNNFEATINEEDPQSFGNMQAALNTTLSEHWRALEDGIEVRGLDIAYNVFAIGRMFCQTQEEYNINVGGHPTPWPITDMEGNSIKPALKVNEVAFSLADHDYTASYKVAQLSSLYFKFSFSRKLHGKKMRIEVSSDHPDGSVSFAKFRTTASPNEPEPMVAWVNTLDPIIQVGGNRWSNPAPPSLSSERATMKLAGPSEGGKARRLASNTATGNVFSYEDDVYFQKEDGSQVDDHWMLAINGLASESLLDARTKYTIKVFMADDTPAPPDEENIEELEVRITTGDDWGDGSTLPAYLSLGNFSFELGNDFTRGATTVVKIPTPDLTKADLQGDISLRVDMPSFWHRVKDGVRNVFGDVISWNIDAITILCDGEVIYEQTDLEVEVGDGEHSMRVDLR